MKLHQIMIYVSVVGLVVAVLMNFVGAGVSKGLIEETNDPRITLIMNSTEQMYTTSEQTKEDLQQLKGNPNVLDILGTIVSGAYGALKTTGATYDTAYQVTFVSFMFIPLGANAALFTNTIGLILLIVIFIGIWLAAYLKSDRI